MSAAEVVGAAPVFAASGLVAGAAADEGVEGAGPGELAGCGTADARAVWPGANERKYATRDFISPGGATTGGMPPAFIVAFGAWMSFTIWASESFATRPLIGGILPAPAPASP